MIFEIDDKLEEEFRNTVFQRKGLKRGVIKDALIEAMNLWIKSDILKNLEEKAMDEKTMPLEMEQIVNSIKSQGKVGVYTLTKLIKKPNLVSSETDVINNAIQELSKQKESI